ncbi:MAG: hypothetical protein NWT04_17065, partial [Verrucomicrobiales bacterium]|nr:hypothetical protein [Verrucomicrobiales bacterium]
KREARQTMATKKTATIRDKRPVFSAEIGVKICDMIAEGSNLTRISKIPGMPVFATMAKWMRENPSFGEDYARARESRADSRQDRIDEIGAKLERGEIDAATARVLVDIEKWQAGKEKPKEYGDEQRINLGGSVVEKFFETLQTGKKLRNGEE